MASLKESAMAYEPPTTLNIADLDKVPVDVQIRQETHTKKDSEETFTVNVIEINGKKYRVPNSVLEGMQAILKKLPNTKYIGVIKSGSGLNTKYQVVPYDEVKVEKIVG